MMERSTAVSGGRQGREQPLKTQLVDTMAFAGKAVRLLTSEPKMCRCVCETPSQPVQMSSLPGSARSSASLSHYRQRVAQSLDVSRKAPSAFCNTLPPPSFQGQSLNRLSRPMAQCGWTPNLSSASLFISAWRFGLPLTREAGPLFSILSQTAPSDLGSSVAGGAPSSC